MSKALRMKQKLLYERQTVLMIWVFWCILTTLLTYSHSFYNFNIRQLFRDISYSESDIRELIGRVCAPVTCVVHVA